MQKHGNSASVVIPRPFLYHLGWVIGQGVMIELLDENQGLLVRLPRLEDLGPTAAPHLVQQHLLGQK